MRANTKEELASLALTTELGLNPISSFEGRGGAAKIAKRSYEQIVSECLSLYPWDFAKRMVKLSRRTEAPVAQWKYKFGLPSDMLGGPHKVLRSADINAPAFKDFEIMSDADKKTFLFANEPAIWIVYVHRQPEANFPPHFVNFVKTALAADWAMPLRENAELARNKFVEAWGEPHEQQRGGKFRRARQVDSMQGGTQRFEDFTLINARAGGG